MDKGKEGTVVKKIFLIMFCVLVLNAFIIIPLYSKDKKKEDKGMELTIKSPAFAHGGMIPKKFTCDGADISPSVSWSKGPEETKSYAIISDDPDAPMGTWVHWVIYNLPAGVTTLPENVPKTGQLDNGILQGKNDFGNFGYGGPCPPGGTHRYYFKVYALDITIKNGPGLTKKQLLKEIDRHILAQGELMGKYTR
jgi:Raf kinase inhibitor-like YbhB/YbcL family protein